jgi:hypothetical protein
MKKKESWMITKNKICKIERHVNQEIWSRNMGYLPSYFYWIYLLKLVFIQLS